MRRWPVLALVVALLVAGVAYDEVEAGAPAVDADPVVIPANPALGGAEQLSSVWYCPVGSAGGGYAEHTVEVANVGEGPAVATVSVLTDRGPGPATRLDLGAGTRRSVALSELEAADAAGAVVEVISGQGVVAHAVATPQGPVGGPCATAASDQWHFAGGITTRDAGYQLALLNPFAEDAVFDVHFEAVDRSRTPASLQGAVVPARSVRVIDVGAAVAREPAVAATVSVRRGRLVAERLQTFDGVLGPVGAELQLGSPGPVTRAWYPAGRLHAGGQQRLVLYNPTDTVAELDVGWQPLDPASIAAFGLVPLEVTIGPGRFEVVDLVATAGLLGLPLPFDVGLTVTSVNDVAFVAERWSLAPPVDPTVVGAGTAPDQAPPEGGEGVSQPPVPAAVPGTGPDLPQATPTRGVVIDRGLTVTARRWVVPAAPLTDPEGTVVVVTATEGAVAVTVGSASGAEELAALDLGPGERALIPLPATGGTADLVVEATGPVVVAAHLVDGAGALSVLDGIPVLEGPQP